MRIIVDIDDVCADLLTVWLDRYNAEYEDHLTRNNIMSWDVSQYVKPECGKKIYDYLTDEHIYDEVKPILGALDGVKQLREMGHDLMFVTANVHREKLNWLKRYGFHPDGWTSNDYACVYKKGWLKADILIDDKPENAEQFEGLAILMDQPHNRYFDVDPYSHIVRAMDWEEIVGFVSWHELGKQILPDFSYAKFDNNAHPTEKRYPDQTKGFREIIDKMYAVHLDKNADYSPANILGTGEVGLMTRFWDKSARLMNLMGFKLDVALKEFVPPCIPKNESIEDSLMDAAVYAIIWMLYRQGKWGR